MTVYVWRDGKMVDKATGEPIKLPKRRKFATPQVLRPLPELASPNTGKIITCRSGWREDMKRAGTVPYERLPGSPRAYRNPTFTKKRGLPLDVEI